MNQTPPYTCICCGYTTRQKNDMRKHFNKKKPCPKVKNVIELTDDIKEHILANKIYIIPEEKPVSINNHIINNYINNNNIITNYISNLDTIDKLNKYMNHTKQELIDFEQSVEERYTSRVKRLEINDFKYGFALKTDDLLEIIDDISSMFKNNNIDYFNIIYDKATNKLKYYDCGVWEEYLINSGLTKIITTIQSYYLDTYECYLIRNIINDFDESYVKISRYNELLQEYYKFIGFFDVAPYIRDKHDGEILNNHLETYDIEEKYYPMYIKIRDKSTKSEINFIKRSVIDIIKRNTSRNINELNTRVFNLFQMDETFKKTFLIQN